MVVGVRTEIGHGESAIAAFDLFDPTGLRVTDEYETTWKTGDLHVYERLITVTSNSYDKLYDATPLVPESDGYILGGEGLSEGHRLDVQLTATITNAGKRNNYFTVKVFDGDTDVSYKYRIVRSFGELKINPIEITVTAGTMRFTYDGETVFSHNEYTVEGQVLDGHIVVVTIVGELSNIGRTTNHVASVKIYTDEEIHTSSTDVTGNYSIKYVDGMIYVDPPQE